MPLPIKLRTTLGRIRLALGYSLGRQAMMKGVTSYEDDVWVVSYPKSGNTWTRFLIANLVARDTAVDWTNIERLVPDIYAGRDSLYRSLPRPRYFKSHESYRPEYRRVVFIVRDPRDVAVSYFHFAKKTKALSKEASFDEFMPLFLEGRIDPYGSWGENVGSWLGARRGSPGFLVIRYEDLLTDTIGELIRIAQMLKLPYDDEVLQRAIENSRADRMRQLEQLQQGQHRLLRESRADIPFVRAAKSGQWRTELPAAGARQIEQTWGPVMRELGYVEPSLVEAER